MGAGFFLGQGGDKSFLTDRVHMMKETVTYAKADVDTDLASAAKGVMVAHLGTPDTSVVNELGALASLFEATGPGIEDPLLVLKVQERARRWWTASVERSS